MTSLRLSSHSQILFPFFPTLALTSPCIQNIPPLILPSLPCTPSELTGPALGRGCWVWPLCFLLPWVRGPATGCGWCPSRELMPIQGADGRAYPPSHPISKVLAPLLQMHFLLFLFKWSNTPHPLNWTLSLPLVQDQFWAPWHLKIKLSYWFIDAWYLHFPFL